MYWGQAGPVNTEQTIDAAVNRANQLGIKYLLVASCSGATINKVIQKDSGLSIVGVTHHVGFTGPGEDEMEPDIREKLKTAGVKLLTTTHLLAGVDRALRFQFGGLYPAEIIAQTLRMFGQGVKVAVEIAVMALDAGLIPYGVDVVSLAGSAEGADSAIVVHPAHSNKFFDTEIREIICMPSQKKKSL